MASTKPKKIVICGAGEVGRHTAEVLSATGHAVTVIDHATEALAALQDVSDVRTLKGSSCHAEVLGEADVSKANLVVAATEADEINLLTAAVAKRMGADRVVARVHHRAFLDRETLDYAEALDIDHIICPEYLTALVIARTLQYPGAMAIERFAQDRIEMQQYEIPPESPAAGVRLSDLNLPAGVRIATIKRGPHATMAERDSVFHPGDIVTIVGETKHTSDVRKMFRQDLPTRQRVVIMGGSAMGVWLARALKDRRFALRMFETNRARAEELSNKLEHVTVIQSDPTDPAVFREENLASCSAFVAVSSDDEHNILAAVQAKELGAPLTVVVIQHTTYLRLLSRVGIDHPYSPRTLVAKEILRLIDDSPVRHLATLAEDLAEVYELNPTPAGPAVGKPLKDVRLPRGCFVAAVQREDDVRVPGAEDQVQAGDGLIVIGPPGIEPQLQSLFIG